MTAIELHQPKTIEEKTQYAKLLADASLLPKQYQRQPGNVLLAIELGESLGIPPIQAINTVHVIEGKPSASAALISALVRRAGHTLRVKGDDQSATAHIVRNDDPDFTYEVTWTLDRAKTAGLLSGKNNWAKYPAAMLKARAVTEVARDACQEALMGVQYTPEELGAVVDQEGNPVEPVRPAPVRQPARQRQQPKPAPASTEPRDWYAELDQCESADDVKRVAADLKAVMGEVPEELKTTINSLWASFQEPAVEEVQGEVIADPETGEIQDEQVA